MVKILKSDQFVLILFVLAMLPSTMVFFQRDSVANWWLMLTSTAFLSGILFCAFYNQFLEHGRTTFKTRFNLLNRSIEFHDWLPTFLSVAVLFPMLILERKELETGAVFALLAAVIVSLKVFKITISKAYNHNERKAN